MVADAKDCFLPKKPLTTAPPDLAIKNHHKPNSSSFISISHSDQFALPHQSMKREGRQHGMVRAYPVAAPTPWLSSAARHVPRYNAVNHQTTAGRFTLAPSKPTNHSKFTGRYVRPRWSTCHDNPACKPRDKAKGAHKLRSYNDVASTCRLVSGVSASGILDFLGDDCVGDEADDDDHLCEEGEGEGEEGLMDRVGTVKQTVKIESGTGGEIKDVAAAAADDDNMSFCEVGFVCDLVDGDEEGWCVVGDLWTPQRGMMGGDDLDL